jgi:hypothetical protein
MQYRRAVQLYYRKFHAYPPNADALVKTNDIRFLRMKYVDPITGKVDWKPVLFGQNKTPAAMGFFGQPLAGGATSIAGIGPSGGNGLSGSGPGGPVLPNGISSIFGGSSNSSTPSAGSTSTGSTGSPTDNSGGSGGGSTSSTTSSTTNSTSSTSSGTTSSGGTGSSSGSDQSGQTFGGGGIIGFSPPSPKKSILIYKKKNHYNEWEFTYDPLSDMQTMTGGNAGGNGLPGGSTSSQSGSSPFGSQTPSPGTPTLTPSPSPNAPQQ